MPDPRFPIICLYWLQPVTHTNFGKKIEYRINVTGLTLKTGITTRHQIPKRKEFLVENNRLNRFNALFLLQLSAILLHSSKNVSL